MHKGSAAVRYEYVEREPSEHKDNAATLNMCACVERAPRKQTSVFGHEKAFLTCAAGHCALLHLCAQWTRARTRRPAQAHTHTHRHTHTHTPDTPRLKYPPMIVSRAFTRPSAAITVSMRSICVCHIYTRTQIYTHTWGQDARSKPLRTLQAHAPGSHAGGKVCVFVCRHTFSARVIVLGKRSRPEKVSVSCTVSVSYSTSSCMLRYQQHRQYSC